MVVRLGHSLPYGGISWSMDMSFLSAYAMKIVMEDIVVNVMFMTRLDIKKHDFLDWKVMHSYVVINGIPICNCLCSHKNHVF